MLGKTLRQRLNPRGDTIVEVMVVLAVLGLALGISYATANSSLLGTRSAEENSQATALLQGQIEELRSLANSATQNIFVTGPYCINNSSDKITSSGNASCAAGQSLYNISVSQTDATNNTFKLVAIWADVSGQGNDSVTLYCRIHPGK